MSRAIGAVLGLAYKGAVDIEFEIAAVGDGEQAVDLSSGMNGGAAGRSQEVGIVGTCTAVVAAQEKRSLAGDLKVVELAATDAEEQAGIIAGEEGDISLDGGVADREGIGGANLKGIRLLDNDMIAASFEHTGRSLGPATVDVAIERV